jgi:hypothetical protein
MHFDGDEPARAALTDACFATVEIRATGNKRVHIIEASTD